MIDATGTRRRLQALAVMGYDLSLIVFSMGPQPDARATAETLLEVIFEARSTVDPTLAEAIATVYRSLTPYAGPSHRARNDARGYGWLGPTHWDTWSIDDPLAGPVADEPDEGDDEVAPEDFIDETALERAMADGDARPLTRPERLEAIRRLGGPEKMSAGQAAHRLGLSMNVTRSLMRTLEAA